MSFCASCGAKIEEGSLVCASCGTATDAVTPNASAGATPVPVIVPGAVSSDGAANNSQSAYAQVPQGSAAGVAYASAPQNFDPYDHTSEFDPSDISKNKAVAMLCYLLSFLGLIVAALIGQKSEYTMFHVRQSIKFLVVDSLCIIAMVLTFWLVIPLFIIPPFMFVLFIIKLITFCQICSGQAKEPAIIRSLGFLK